MGVSGCGKSTVGEQLAEYYEVPFFDADDYHSSHSVKKMAAGEPLTDADRVEWLDRLAGLVAEHKDVVLACSALKERYRVQLGQLSVPSPRFIYLAGDFALIRERLRARTGHYFSGDEMLHSQFNTLEVPEPEKAAHISIDAPLDKVLSRCRAYIDGSSSTNI
ncbi:gluconate kinase [Halomonas sp. SH5A2]|nr:gluconate kinase [Halomonas sp. SH5A2]